MKKISVMVLMGVLYALVVSTWAWAGGCPEGKAEVKINLPNGMEKIICIPDNALQGLENAAEHSDGTIVPSSCPCWNATDIKYFEEKNIIYYCRLSYTLDAIACYAVGEKGITETVLEANTSGCVNYVTETKAEITKDQFSACVALLEAFKIEK